MDRGACGLQFWSVDPDTTAATSHVHAPGLMCGARGLYSVMQHLCRGAGFSSCSAWALGHESLVVVVCRLLHVGS